MLTLSDDQAHVYDDVLEWAIKASVLGSTKIQTLAGLAGTGKTTLISMLITELLKSGVRTALMAYTGRASLVLANKCEAAGAHPATCSTIHRFLYKPLRLDGKVHWIRIPTEELREICDLIIVDEASMVGKAIYDDLRATRIPILFVGDHGQLPPVDDRGFNIMDNADWKLEHIHRQAEDSPIIRLAHDIRNGVDLAPQNGGSSLIVANKRSKAGTDILNQFMHGRSADKDVILLCGMNWTRINLNKKARKALGHETDIPDPGEKVVCLKNDTELGIMNGYLGSVESSIQGFRAWYSMTVNFDTEVLDIERCRSDFLNEKSTGALMKDIGYQSLRGVGVFDYGYAVSVHKAQGSEWDVVLLYAERNKYQNDEEWRRWLYTGVTRAKTKLAVLI